MTDSQWVMVLGGGTMQLPALRVIRRRGWHSIVVDGNSNAPGRDQCDKFLHIDLKDYERIASVGEQLRAEGELDAVFTAGTDFSTSVAYVAQHLGLPGITFESALNAKDKLRMRERFSAHGVPSPKFFGIESDDSDILEGAEDKAATIGFPLVVKPVDNMGARGVTLVSGTAELRAAILESLGYSASGRVIVEERISGPEYSLDALVHDGRVKVCGIADRHISFAPYFVEMGHTLPAALSTEDTAELTNVFGSAIRALGIESGAAKGDIFLTDDGPMVGEVAARLSGGYMSGWTYPLATGVEVTEAAIRIALGWEPGDLTPKRRHTTAERAFISIPGRVAAVEGVERARAVEEVKELFVRITTGEYVRLPRNNVEKCGNVIASAPTREKAIAAAEEAVANIVVRLEPNVEETFAYLLGHGEEFCVSHRAYPLTADSEKLLLGMPPGTLEISNGTVYPFLNSEQERDWSYRTLSESVSRIMDRFGLVWCEEDRGAALGREFWLALVRGGLPGGLFIVESLHNEPALARNYIEQWTNREDVPNR